MPTETDETRGLHPQRQWDKGTMTTERQRGLRPQKQTKEVGGVCPQRQPMGGVHPQFTKTEQRQGGESTPTQFHKEIDRGYDANGDGWHGDELDDVTVRVPCPYVWTYIMVARIP